MQFPKIGRSIPFSSEGQRVQLHKVPRNVTKKNRPTMSSIESVEMCSKCVFMVSMCVAEYRDAGGVAVSCSAVLLPNTFTSKRYLCRWRYGREEFFVQGHDSTVHTKRSKHINTL